MNNKHLNNNKNAAINEPMKQIVSGTGKNEAITENAENSCNLDISNSEFSLGKVLAELELETFKKVEKIVTTRIENFIKARQSFKDKTEYLNKKQKTKVLNNLEVEKKTLNSSKQTQIEQQKQDDERLQKKIEKRKMDQYQEEFMHVFEMLKYLQNTYYVYENNIVESFQRYSSYNIQESSVVMEISENLKILHSNMENIKLNCIDELERNIFTNSEQIKQAINFSSNYVKFTIDTIKKCLCLRQMIQTELAKIENEMEQRKKETIQTTTITAAETTKLSTTTSQSLIKTASSSSSSSSSYFSNKIEPIEPFQEEKKIVPKKVEKQSEKESSSKMIVSDFSNKKVFLEYLKTKKLLEDYNKNLSSLLSNPEFKQLRFQFQRAVNTPLNAISDSNPQHFLDKYVRLSNLLRGNPVEVGKSVITLSQYPPGLIYCTGLLAKKFVLQGDLQISSKPESAFCYAAILGALWHDFPEFGKLVLANFYDISPYLVPYYPPKLVGQSNQDYYKSLGYNYSDGVVEKQDKFLKRMSGIMRLYAHVIICKLKRGQKGPHPHGLIYAWKWLANILNLEPRCDITATLLCTFLEVTGSSLLAAYGKQFKKLLTFLNDVYLEKLRVVGTTAAVTRFEVLLQKIRQHGPSDPPKWRLPDGFW